MPSDLRKCMGCMVCKGYPMHIPVRYVSAGQGLECCDRPAPMHTMHPGPHHSSPTRYPLSRSELTRAEQ
ncbi:hypothetical protein JOF41_007339 [Saccharothrix coeruleofusca]|nr:hypothetical protein [Saccharothrix coeruleofusca]